MEEVQEMIKNTITATVNEINLARQELIVGRQEECYNILTNLSDELTNVLQ